MTIIAFNCILSLALESNKETDMEKARVTDLTSRLLSLGAVLFTILLLYSQQLSAQLKEFLLLEKPGAKKRMRYYKGDEVAFMLKDLKQFFTKQIVGLSDTSFF
jgi:hypothetical protein